jgi:predicted  nucleic acid-binding Zn-ribbon protein
LTRLHAPVLGLVQVDAQIQQIQHRMEEKLNELAPAKRDQYYDMQRENNSLLESIAKLETEYEELSYQVSRMCVRLFGLGSTA